MTWNTERINETCSNCQKQEMYRDFRSAGELTQWKKVCKACGRIVFTQFEGDEITKHDVWSEGRTI